MADLADENIEKKKKHSVAGTMVSIVLPLISRSLRSIGPSSFILRITFLFTIAVWFQSRQYVRHGCGTRHMLNRRTRFVCSPDISTPMAATVAVLPYRDSGALPVVAVGEQGERRHTFLQLRSLLQVRSTDGRP